MLAELLHWSEYCVSIIYPSMQDGSIDIVLALILRKKKNYVDRTNKVRNSWTKASMMESQKAAEIALLWEL